MTYWQIGKTVKTELLQEGRAPYGAEILKQLAERLTQQFGSGFSHSGLTRMVKFYGYLPEGEIVATLSQQLSWSHFVELVKIEDELKREFYIRVCVEARWSVRTLRGRMDSMLYERTALAKKSDAVIQQELALMPQQPARSASPALFLKDPYLCSDTDAEVVELMDLEQDNTRSNKSFERMRYRLVVLLAVASDGAPLKSVETPSIGIEMNLPTPPDAEYWEAWYVRCRDNERLYPRLDRASG